MYYRNGPSMTVVPIRTSPTLAVGTPRAAVLPRMADSRIEGVPR
jgi:hypothetical protein